MCRNLILTMLLGGLWHGASWTFIVWGLYHGALLALHKVIPWPQWLGRPWAKPLCVATTFFAFCIGLVFFRAQSFGDAGTMLQHMFTSVPGQTLDVLALTTVLGILAIVFLGHLAGTFLDTRRWERWLPAPALGMGLAALVVLIFLFFPEDGKAFIYFQF